MTYEEEGMRIEKRKYDIGKGKTVDQKENENWRLSPDSTPLTLQLQDHPERWCLATPASVIFALNLRA
jgi:hypothetical protein